MCIVNAHNNGKGYQAISKLFRVPVSKIQSRIKKHKKFHTLESVVGSQRYHLVLLAKSIVRLLTTLESPPRPSKHNLSELGTDVSGRTIRRTLHKKEPSPSNEA